MYRLVTTSNGRKSISTAKPNAINAARINKSNVSQSDLVSSKSDKRTYAPNNPICHLLTPVRLHRRYKHRYIASQSKRRAKKNRHGEHREQQHRNRSKKHYKDLRLNRSKQRRYDGHQKGRNTCRAGRKRQRQNNPDEHAGRHLLPRQRYNLC